ncbi:helix-turn-helix domain-containing protein [Streptosporangium sp. NBC_01639]|uniref:helix-turn-helix domain-containing protein n=1 Tax=Streptosporangium sp. NBC_01639 TaxID=2975948 RepID=UPI00386C8764|nr:helix-turn-helix domain-containing protein [Streptosporangium sp. NBC_01639]
MSGGAVTSGRRKRAESRYAEQAARLGPKLRELRLKRGYTQQQLATSAEIELSTLRKMETAAVVEPGYFTILSLLKALGARVEDLMV